ncbi:phospholipase A and acyltransferase 1-like [Clytia hemisphaerica]|uniref:phospholipase A and acyltransferase 1-like n=1 Tax=Clytia hemisphaerica TaxID=252671 RepID=UPI0034D4D937
MGSSTSKSSSSSSSRNPSSALVAYDRQAATRARSFDKSDFSSPQALVHHLQPGDLIQVKGENIYQWFYSHFAVYIGNGEIVHVTEPKVKREGSKIWVLREKMVEAFAGRSVRKNNHLDDVFPVKRVQDIIREARGKVRQPWEYNFLTNNCEHFASQCRYGRRISLQSISLVDVNNGDLTVGEYLGYHARSVKEKCNTFKSWVKRKYASTTIANLTNHLAIQYNN